MRAIFILVRKNIGQRVHTQLNRPNTTGIAKYGVAYILVHVPTRIRKLLTNVTCAHHATKYLTAI